mmetsp:Transcript_51076/g.121345  ORF Transcript_51076/g.121345 Transcript_51076/m.121345 type:complete len:302 (-) Transcript_51076:10-915(-)
MIDGEPGDRLRHDLRVHIPEHQLAAVCPQVDTEHLGDACGALEEVAQEAAALGGQSLHAQTNDAVTWHGSEGLVVHADGRQQGHVNARLILFDADAVSHEHSLRLAISEVSLREANGGHISHHRALRQALPFLHLRAVDAHVHGSGRLPGRVAAVLLASGALAGAVRQQDGAGAGVEHHLQRLRRVADSHVGGVEGRIDAVRRAHGALLGELNRHRTLERCLCWQGGCGGSTLTCRCPSQSRAQICTCELDAGKEREKCGQGLVHGRHHGDGDDACLLRWNERCVSEVSLGEALCGCSGEP